MSFEVEAETEKEAYAKFMSDDYRHEPVGAVEIGKTLDAEPKINVEEKDESD